MIKMKAYDAKIDSKKRITLRGARAEYYHVEEKKDGTIVLSPRVLVHPEEISDRTMETIQQSVSNLKKGKASSPIDLREVKLLLD